MLQTTFSSIYNPGGITLGDFLLAMAVALALGMLMAAVYCFRSQHSRSFVVTLALLPATVAGVVLFGWQALLPVAMCVACCVGFEALFNLIAKKAQTVGDLSAAVTGLLLALNLPANIPLWQCVIGALFAMVVVKGLFGGLGASAASMLPQGRTEGLTQRNVTNSHWISANP